MQYFYLDTSEQSCSCNLYILSVTICEDPIFTIEVKYISMNETGLFSKP